MFFHSLSFLFGGIVGIKRIVGSIIAFVGLYLNTASLCWKKEYLNNLFMHMDNMSMYRA